MYVALFGILLIGAKSITMNTFVQPYAIQLMLKDISLVYSLEVTIPSAK